MSAVRKAYKYRIYPTKQQEDTLAIQFGHARFVYNAALAASSAAYKETGKGINYYDTAWMLKFWKQNLVWLKDADSQVLQQSLGDLKKAFGNFFEGRAGYPKFKGKYSNQSIHYPQRFRVDGSRIYLPKVGRVRAIFHRPIEGTMKNLTVTKTKSGKYFISIQCEVELPEPLPLNGVVGIDLGIKSFAVLSRPILWNGEMTDTIPLTERGTIPHPAHFRKAERKLKALQRKYSRTQKGSNGRNKARLRVARQHEKVANQRADFLHKLSNAVTKTYGHIKIENLNVSGMVKNHSLAKSISDSGWSEFGRQLGYKSEWRGGFTEKTERFFASSKTCSVCGLVYKGLQLKDRFWTCSGCGSEHDRDKNAAVNIECFDTSGGSRRIIQLIIPLD